MKKTAIALSICMILTLIPVFGAVSSANSDYLVLGDHTSGIVARNETGICTWTDDYTDLFISADNNIGMKTTGDNPSAGTSIGVRNGQDNDVSGYDYFEFYTDMTEMSPDAAFPFAFRVIGPGQDVWYSSFANKTVQFVVNGAVSNSTFDSNGRLMYPANFKGYVRIPVSTLSAAGVDVTKVSEFVMWYGDNMSNYIGKSVYFNNFRFGYEEEELVTAYPVPGELPEAESRTVYGNTSGVEIFVVPESVAHTTKIETVEYNSKSSVQVKNMATPGDVAIDVVDTDGVAIGDAEYFEFWIDVTEISTVNGFHTHFILCTSNDGSFGSRRNNGAALNIQYLIDGEWVTYACGGDWAIPANFSGYVRISLAELANAYDQYWNSKQIEMGDTVTKFEIYYTASDATLNKSFYVDNFSLVKPVTPKYPVPGDLPLADSRTEFSNTSGVGSNSNPTSEITEITTVENNGAKSLRVKRTGTTSANGSSDIAIDMLNEGVAIGDAEYFEFWIDVTEVSLGANFPTHFFLCTSNGGSFGSRRENGAALNIQYLIDGEWVTYACGTNWAIPANFSGYVRISLAELANAYDPYKNSTKIEMGDTVTQFEIYSGEASGRTDKSFYVNNFSLVQEYTVGDLTGDRIVNVLDLLTIKDCALSNSFDGAPKADVNGDGVCDIFDVVAVKNMILGK